MILKRLGHTALGLIVCLLGGLAVTSCDDGPAVNDKTESGDDNMVNLLFSVVAPESGVPGMSRVVDVQPCDTVYFEEPSTRYEKIHTLRVIIISQGDGIVEHNKLFTLQSGGVTFYDDMTFKVKGGDKKTIYLIANEKALRWDDSENPLDLSAIGVGEPAEEASALDNITVKADGTTGVLYDNTVTDRYERVYIPMCAKYTDVEVRPIITVDDRNQILPKMYINRGAVKFSFSVTPFNNEDMYLKEITFDGVADRMYMFPHDTEYKVSTYNGLTGWIVTEYSVPENAHHRSVTFTPPADKLNEDGYLDLVAFSEDKPWVWSPQLYYCESKIAEPPSLTTNFSPYGLSITIARRYDKDGRNVYEETRLPAVMLPNLPTLPRNTHVKVNIKIYFLNAVVELVPYTGVWLDPIFGIERD